ncbi:MAG: peptidoglycan-binding domain-containing protein [Oscillospiraceae bacterium]
MATIYVFNNATNAVEKYIRASNEPMPYNIGGTLTVREFLRGSGSDTAWTDLVTMNAFNQFRSFWGKPIVINYAFNRIKGAGEPDYPQRFAGTFFSMGGNMRTTELEELHDAAVESGAFHVVYPLNPRIGEVYMDVRYLPANLFVTSGFPYGNYGMKGNYVFLMQDCLIALGYDTGGLDGIFGEKTRDAVKRYQNDRYLTDDGFVGRVEWDSLLFAAGYK